MSFTGGAILTLVGTFVVVAGTYLGTKLTARETRKAKADEVQQRRESDELLAWRELAGDYRSRLETLEGRQQAHDERLQRTEDALRDERQRREVLGKQLDDERDRVTALERRFRAAVTYIRALLDLLLENGIEPPAPPEGIEIPAAAGRKE